MNSWQCFQVFPFWDFLNGMVMQMLNICRMILVHETKTCLLLWRWICMTLSCCTAATGIIRVSAGLLLWDLNLMPFTAETTLLCVTQVLESNFHSAQSMHDIWNKDCSKCERHKEEPPCTHGFYTVSSPPLALPYRLWRFVCCSSSVCYTQDSRTSDSTRWAPKSLASFGNMAVPQGHQTKTNDCH